MLVSFPLLEKIKIKTLHEGFSLKGDFTFAIFHPYLLPLSLHWTSLVAQWYKNLSVSAGDVGLIPVSGRSIPWEKGMTTHSSFLSWEIPWEEEPGRLQSVASQKSWT